MKLRTPDLFRLGTLFPLLLSAHCSATEDSPGDGGGALPAIDGAATSGDSGTGDGGGAIQAATVSFSPTLLPATTEVPGPFRALEQWIGGWAVSFPADASPQVGNCFDDYMRFKWTDIQDDAGNYKWAMFDAEIQHAIDARRKFHFAIIPMGTLGFKPQMVGGGKLTYPLFAHNKMQAEPIKDWIETPDNFWVPNWNSASYLTEWEQLHTAVASHIAASSYKGVAYATAIGVIEINGFGNWGEWHNYPWTAQEPPNTAMTGASAKRVIDANLNAYPEFQQTIPMSAFAGPVTSAIQDPSVGYYALTAQTKRGVLGWRRDSWGWERSWLADMLENNPTKYNGLTFGQAIADRWKLAPVTGEPAGGGSTVGGFTLYGALPAEVQRYHVAMLSNGNLESPTDPTLIANVRAAAHLAGYRLVVTGGELSGALQGGGAVKVRLDWQNLGVAPTYEDWAVKVQLRSDAATVVWEASSQVVLRRMVPAPAAAPTSDSFQLPSSLPSAKYGLYVKVVDPAGYRGALPLAIAGVTTDGAYKLADVTTR